MTMTQAECHALVLLLGEHELDPRTHICRRCGVHALRIVVRGLDCTGSPATIEDAFNQAIALKGQETAADESFTAEAR